MASNDLALSYSPPMIMDGNVVIQDPMEPAKEVDKWKHSLIVVGYFIAKFKEEDDLKEILYGEPYKINNKSIILKKWSPDIEFDTAFLKEIPIWVSFPNLHMVYWGKDSLRRLGITIGVPLFADECTTNQLRISFARMLIEVNITKPLPTEVKIQDSSGKMYHQAVRFEWQLEFCSDCQRLGHVCKRSEEVQGKPQKIQKVNGKFHQLAKE
ncbi:uncharacterized protein [Nicotiana sylvestris]|uniref:uncharacterized protein n=1 Tax=Nicotiana sylvestris TaxID=4096 RepID=UPI00388CB12D